MRKIADVRPGPARIGLLHIMPAAETRKLKGKTGPSCLYMLSGAQCCSRAGGPDASSQGVSTSEIKKLPGREGKKHIVSEFDARFPGIVDPSAFSSKVHVNDVGTALETSALAFERLAAVDADRWSLAVWNTLSPAEQVARAR